MAQPAVWQTLLKQYHGKLRTGLLMDIVLPDLRPLLRAEEYSLFANKKDDVERVDELVRILLTRDESTFQRFCSVLEKNGYCRWASRLRGKDVGASVSTSSMLHDSSPSASKKFNSKTLWTYLNELIQEMKGDCPVFGILVVGETGVGKSTLINTLVGNEVVEEGHSLVSKTSTVFRYEKTVEGVPLALYDTPGLSDSRGVTDDEYLRKMEDILKSGAIHLVIYCMKLSETRMRASLIRTFEEYNKIGVKWERTIIALTFADYVPVPAAKKKEPDFDEGRYFSSRVAEMRAEITRKLVEKVQLTPDVASEVVCNPSTSDPDMPLVNGVFWYAQFWLDVLELLSPGAAMRFLEMRGNNIEQLHFDPQEGERFRRIFTEKITQYAKTGAKLGALTGSVVGILGGPLGMLLGSGAGAAVGVAIGSGYGFVKAIFSKGKGKKL